MAATANSIHQAILVKHIANNPPNAYPQTANENWNMYFNRMQNQGLPPDIGATESDSDYLARLQTYSMAPYFNISSSYALAATSASYSTVVTSSTSASYSSYAVTASYINGSTQLVNIAAGLSMSFSNGVLQYITA